MNMNANQITQVSPLLKPELKSLADLSAITSQKTSFFLQVQHKEVQPKRNPKKPDTSGSSKSEDSEAGDLTMSKSVPEKRNIE